MLGHLSYQAIFCCSLGKTNQNWSDRCLYVKHFADFCSWRLISTSVLLSLLPPQILPLSLTHILSFAVHVLGFICLGNVVRKNARNDRRIRWNKVQVGSRFPLEFPFNYTSCVFHFSPTCLADSWSFRHDLNNLPTAHSSWMSKLSLKLMNVSSSSRTT